jgi:hypothetical protein
VEACGYDQCLLFLSQCVYIHTASGNLAQVGVNDVISVLRYAPVLESCLGPGPCLSLNRAATTENMVLQKLVTGRLGGLSLNKAGPTREHGFYKEVCG